MASIYDIDFDEQSKNIIPPDKRKPVMLAFIFAIVYAIQIIRDLFYNSYADGSTAPFWISGGTYALGDQTIGTDNAVYEMITVGGITAITTPPKDDTTNWIKIQDIYIGARERLRYNSQKILIEFILNKWYRVPYSLPWQGANHINQIYIQNNLVFLSGFLLGESGPTSTPLANNSLYSVDFLGDAYSFATNTFTIYVPSAVFAAIDPNPTNAENNIRSIANKYIIAGMIYDVVTY